MLSLKSIGEFGSSGCAGGNAVGGGGWTKDDMGAEKIKLRLSWDCECCITVSEVPERASERKSQTWFGVWRAAPG